jgi:hypothetical protein
VTNRRQKSLPIKLVLKNSNIPCKNGESAGIFFTGYNDISAIFSVKSNLKTMFDKILCSEANSRNSTTLFLIVKKNNSYYSKN